MDLKTYEAILDSIDSPIMFVDNSHIIRYMNKAAQIQFEKIGLEMLQRLLEE